MTEFETFQHELLKKLGYNVVPFYDDAPDIYSKYVYFKESKIIFLDSNAKEVHREHSKIERDILLRYTEEGCYYCPPQSENGEPILYHPGNRKNNWRYLILWEDNEYTELDYLNDSELMPDDFFEYINTGDYIAIKYHKAGMSEQERLEKHPLLDTVISRKNEIEHIGVFAYFANDKNIYDNDFNNDKIVVYDDGRIIVYNQNFNVLYEKEDYCGDFGICECEQKSFILFLSDTSAYDLSENKYIKLLKNTNYSWYTVKTYKNIFICLLYTKKGECTAGHVFNADFRLIREFNVIGEIVEIKEIGGAIIMKVVSSTKDYEDIEKYYNLRGKNIIYHDIETNEDYSFPDIYCRNMGLLDSNLYIVKSKVSPADFIDFENGTNIQGLTEKCGVYCKEWGDKYTKIIECKYDYIHPIPLDESLKYEDREYVYVNIYYIGIIGRDENKKFDLYINHEMILQGIPYDKSDSLKILGNDKFISTKDSAGHSIVIRHGKIIFTTSYDIVDIYIGKEYIFHIDDTRDSAFEDKTKYLIVVSDNDLYGIYSSSGKLLLPIEYSIIEIDEYLTIVLGKRIEDNTDIDEYEESILYNGLIMKVGHYSPKEDIITHETAVVEDNIVYLDNETDYIWNGEFKHRSCGREDWSNYSYRDSIYDALGGEMEAIWNID